MNTQSASLSETSSTAKLPEGFDDKKLRTMIEGASKLMLIELDAEDSQIDQKQALRDYKQELEEQLEQLTGGSTALVKVKDPESMRDTYHQDYMMQEMQWMSGDFGQERKWKQLRAKKLLRAVKALHKQKENQAARDAKRIEANRKKIAARIGRDVKKFWGKIDKIVAYKAQLEADSAKKKVMDKHLRVLVEQTEKYASAMANSLTTSSEEQEHEKPTAFSIEEIKEEKSPVGYNQYFDAEKVDDSLDYVPRTESQDDETTIAEAEEQQTPEDTEKELKDLNVEASISIDELRAKYSNMDSHESSEEEKDAEDIVSSDDDFVLENGDHFDDESTIAKAEAEESHDENELRHLQEEGELSIEELRARYVQLEDENPSSGDDINEDITETSKNPGDVNGMDVDEDDNDFVPAAMEQDDESSIAKAEREESLRDKKDELRQLQEESELSIEELRARYSMMDETSDNEDQNDESDAEELNSADEYLPADQDGDDETTIAEAEEREEGTKDDEIKKLQEESEMSIEELRQEYNIPSSEAATTVEGINSTTSTPESKIINPTTPRPFLLSSRLKLRHYQHVGLDWLVSLYTRRLNGILADEMGLGKTIQTISLLAELACNKGIWGPHLIVVPTSCLVNWEMEFKRWCPAFKVLSYYGSAKRRKELRQGWARSNAFQICITSYQLVVQDAHCFRRKKWYFLILDEAHNIKNWKSQRWQTLLNFNSQRRLLLTGTPLQNNLMELWALMHFLMPHVFRSRKEFSYWFSSPLNSMVEGEQSVNDSLVSRLHGVIRPFVLRRLKKDVAKQLPEKFEHTITCALSKRQRNLYEDFMSRSSTRNAMSGGNFLGMMNVLMQLRKVCNHPDLFEPRPIESPFDMDCIRLDIPSLILKSVERSWDDECTLRRRALDLVNMEMKQVDMYIWKQIQRTRVDRDTFVKGLQAYSVKTTDSKDELEALLDRMGMKDIAHREYVKNHVCGRETQRRLQRNNTIEYLAVANDDKCSLEPILGHDLIRKLTIVDSNPVNEVARYREQGHHRGKILSSCLLDLIKHPHDRIQSMSPLVNHVACIVPKVRSTNSFKSIIDARCSRELLSNVKRKVLEPISTVYYNSYKRTKIFFPDKRLIQFDCGKLQQLDVLLRKLKPAGHRCLIFTQMSSMLDILEVFLSIHGHTYFRLDGSTKVERRQYLMDRFNMDEKVFCFILSTRSGGLGINLTGADTVIFYDSDWNPAMDAQAQDRAHRIGQTRDVHIYRLVSEHTVEENILKKAQQKRHLDFLVMSEGKFTTDFYSKANLRELVGHEMDNRDDEMDVEDDTLSKNDMEDAMAKLEDAEDVEAMRGAKQELFNEQHEFDCLNSNVNLEDQEDSDSESGTESSATKDDDADSDPPKGKKRKLGKANLKSTNAPESPEERALKAARKAERKRERALELEQERQLQKWKESVSLSRFEEGLRPIDRFALHFRQEIEYPWNWSAVYQQQAEAQAPAATEPVNIELEIARIEEQKRIEEETQLREGELISADLSIDQARTRARQPHEYFQQMYEHERTSFRRERKRRQLTGEAWECRVCRSTNYSYYYNVDTRESVWDQPLVLARRAEYESIQRQGYAGLTLPVLLHVMKFLHPLPDRKNSSFVCKQWSKGALHSSLWHKVTPFDDEQVEAERHDLEYFLAHASVSPGDTIFLSPGVHRIHGSLQISMPLRFLGSSAADCVILLTKGSIEWKASFGLLQKVTLQYSPTSALREKKHDLLQIYSKCHVQVLECIVNGNYASRACIEVHPNGSVVLLSNRILQAGCSGIVNTGGQVLMYDNRVEKNRGNGVMMLFGLGVFSANHFHENGNVGIRVLESSFVHLQHNHFKQNSKGSKAIDSYNLLKKKAVS